MKYFLLSAPLGKGIRVALLLVMLAMNFGPGGASVAYAAPPVHDDFNSAKLINAIEYHDLNVNTTEATPSDTIPNGDDPDNFMCQGQNFDYGFASVWYKYTPPETQSLSLNTAGTTPASYDTFIAVWTGNRGSLNLIACNDENFEGIAELSFVANAGTTYYIEVAQYNDGQGTTDLIGGNLHFNAFITNTNVYVGDSFVARYFVPDGGSLRKSFINLNQGPVQVINLAGNQIIAAERVIYKVNNVPTSFSEMMGLPNTMLSTVYWMPYYNNVDLDSQLRFGNVSASTATVRLYIAGAEKTSGCTPSNSPYTLAPGASLRVSCSGVSAGPVRIVSNVNIVAAERIIYKVNNLPTSFSEMMGLPNSQLSTIFWMPYYNNVDLDSQIRIANASSAVASVQVWIAGVLREQFNLGIGQTLRKSYPISNGPVRIVSTQNIVASQRVIYKVNGLPVSFSEMMGLPNNQLDTIYWLPWYNNVDLNTQLRFANASASPATIRLYIGGSEMTGCIPAPAMAYPYVLAVGQSVRVQCTAVSNGPVRIESTQDIVAAERVIYKVNGANTSFSEMMALPNSFLAVSYWMPWYNNIDLDTQLRFGMP